MSHWDQSVSFKEWLVGILIFPSHFTYFLTQVAIVYIWVKLLCIHMIGQNPEKQ